ncbi:MAG: GAF domain-containing sensor histidine kinase, partial [Deinococcales bacterium]|nr:GAF domain-containing sensor histidine kinase [Chitinophagaceae bacterium]
MHLPPIPFNENQRVLNLSEFDLDYSNLEDNFKDLCKLAAKVAGTDISMINMIDSYTQWTISNQGLPLSPMTREESVCQYTIVENNGFEVPDLSIDNRFNDKFYVAGYPNLKYYYGLPLKTIEGYNIGALCVLDTKTKELNPEKIELLKIIANEIVNRLNALQLIESLKGKVTDITEKQKRVVHDIRGPLSGIIGLAEIISKQGDANKMDQVLEFIKMIHKSSHSILELANEILSIDDKLEVKVNAPNTSEFNLITLKEKLLALYDLQAKNKNIDFNISINIEKGVIPFSKNKLLQIIGNLISNAIKFTPKNSYV